MHETNPSAVITLDEIKQKALGVSVEIPDWGNGTIMVRLRRIDTLTTIAGTGLLPNDLRNAIEGAFGDDGDMGTVAGDNLPDIQMDKFINLLDAICREAMAEPKFDDIQAIYPLTLSQKMAVFDWVMQEVRAIRPFRGRLPVNAGGVPRS